MRPVYIVEVAAVVASALIAAALVVIAMLTMTIPCIVAVLGSFLAGVCVGFLALSVLNAGRDA